MTLCLSEAFRIEKLPNGSRACDKFAGIRRIAMPGKEIQQYVVIAAHRQEVDREIRRNELTVNKTAARSECWSADP